MLIRGALILAVGYGLGHAKGVSENPLILNKIESMTTKLGAWVDKEIELQRASNEKLGEYDVEAALELLDHVKDTLPGMGDQPDDTILISGKDGELTLGHLRAAIKVVEEVVDGEVVDTPTTNAGPQGETPS